MEALSTALSADFPASCVADSFPRIAARPARVWWRCLSASSTVRHSIATSRTKSKTLSGLSYQCPFMPSLLSTLTLHSGACKPATNALLMTAAGPRLNTPRTSQKTFSGLGFSKYCSRWLCTASARSTSVASDPMVTRQHTSAAAKVGSIESPFQPLRVLSKSLAKIVYTGREIDCALLLSSMLRSYTADCVKMRSNAACENTLPY